MISNYSESNFKLLKNIFLVLLLQFLTIFASAQQISIDQKVRSLLKQMTLEEKIGQLNQYTDDLIVTGQVTEDNTKSTQIRNGQVGSILNCLGLDRIRVYQKLALQSRLKIPLLFGHDVIHGYKTTFPIPLAEAASWDLEAMELSARIAAVEASSNGINWSFAPMVDIARDPRWGRVMEGADEDTYLGSLIAKARVKGFLGEKLGDLNSVMACAKHFAAYGAAIGGRDYNSADMSDRTLWEVYLPPFKAAADAGVATFMNSFNDLNGVPATASKYLQRDILKSKWKFTGFIVSDWGSIAGMVTHGSAKDTCEAAFSAITAGCDMDMESRSYKKNLAKLIKDKKIDIKIIDEAVTRILKKKFEIGLFDDPYRYMNDQRANSELNNLEHTKAARQIGAKSIVLLKNKNHLLPLSKNLKKIALIGPMIKLLKDNKGAWSVNVPNVDSTFIVSQWQGIKNKVDSTTQLLYAKGCDVVENDTNGFAEAVSIAKKADVVVLSIGERSAMSGESKSRSNISIPGVQEDLLKVLLATGKPVVVLINAGRPLVFNYTADNAPAILYTWWLGSEAGNAIADVLFGDYNPSAKLPMTFPRNVGQIPIYYSHFNTCNPVIDDNNHFNKSAYIDLSVFPKYEFGYGLSYTTFQYSNLQLSKKSMKASENIEVSVSITNSGKYPGEEIVQLYLRDKVGSIVRPVKELKDFRKIHLNIGETKTIKFIIDKEKMSFYNQKLEWDAEPGDFDLMIGASSSDIRLKDSFEFNN